VSALAVGARSKAAFRQLRRVECDPTESYLDDHRPGGAALLGTVANLDTIAAALAEIIGDGKLVEIANIRLGPALIFPSAAPIAVDVAAEMLGDGAIAVRTTTGADTHLTATFRIADHFPPTARCDLRSVAPGAVTAEDIYACLFHGPALRVIDGAERDGDALIAHSARDLPPLRHHSPASPIAPRAIEFGLQSAGLLQLALDGSMAIPLRIARISRFADTDVGESALLHARAERSADGTFDIAIGHAGAVVARITGYATTPLLFAHDSRAARALADRLNRVSR